MMAAISSDDGDEGWTAELLELFLHGRLFVFGLILSGFDLLISCHNHQKIPLSL